MLLQDASPASSVNHIILYIASPKYSKRPTEESIVREYIRHPSDIPIQYRLVDVVAHSTEYLRDVSRGGLSFRSLVRIEVGTIISIEIPLVRPVFETRSVVVWCRKARDKYNVGVKFMDAGSEFRMRMVEQVCHIESYKRRVLREESRELDGEEAALEWIRKYADDFPRLRT